MPDRVDAFLRPLAAGSARSGARRTLSSSKLIVMAPPARAMARRSGTWSIAITCLAPSRMALRIAIWPTGPAPQIATVSVGSMSHCTAACQPVGKMSPRNSTCSSVSPSGILTGADVGVGHAHIFGLPAGIAAGQMRVAEQAGGGVAEHLVGHILVAVGALADRKIAALALVAFAADDRERHDDPVADLQLLVLGADLDDLAHELVAHDVADLHAGHEAVDRDAGRSRRSRSS